jgi:hypothetical protein
MQVTHPFGLALSGGGFRAAAYHLGVLKRLRELGLLAQIDVLSTVSGGSITGAYWIFWQASQGNTLTDDEEWQKFELSLIRFMQLGVRELAFKVAFVVPAVILAVIAGVFAWFFRPIGVGAAVTLALLVPMVAYGYWHYSSRTVLAAIYTRLFGTIPIAYLGLPPSFAPPGSEIESKLKHIQKIPRLYINATSLNSGSHLFFTGDQNLAINFVRDKVVRELAAQAIWKVRAADPESPLRRVQADLESIYAGIDETDPFIFTVSRA